MTIDKMFCTRSVEFRSATEDPGDGRTLEGYAAVFNQDTEINSWEGHFNERIAKGAFKKTLKERAPIMQFDHGHDARTGSVPIGKFTELREDNDGLFVQARLFDNAVVEPVRQAIEGGAISGMSFRFRVIRDEWRDSKNKLVKGDEILDLLYEPGERGPLQRTIREVQLSEAGPVVFPAYAGTSVGVRSANDMTEGDRAKLAAEYKRTALSVDPDDDAELRSWLDAEQQYLWLDAELRWNEVCKQWLDAETDFDIRSWLDAEQNFVENRDKITTASDDAARSTGTSSDIPEKDAVRTDTSVRESLTSPLERDSAPEKKVKAMTLEELRARLAELEVRQGEIATDEYREKELPADLQTEYDSNKAEITLRKASIAKIEARLEELKSAPTERGSDKSPAFHKESNIYSLEEIRKSSFSGDDFIARTQEAAKKVLERSNLPKGAASDAKDSILEMIEAGVDDGAVAKRAVATGNPAYERAFGRALKAGNTNVLSLEDHRALEEARAIHIGTDGASGDSSSGFAVPFQLDPTLVHLGAGYISPIRQLAKVVQLYGKEYQTLTISEILVYRAAEAAAATATEPTLAQAVLRVNKVHGYVPFSMEADEDWAAMRSEIFQLLQEAKDKEEANAFLLGNGTAPNPQGLIVGATSTVTAGSATALTLADIYALMEALPVEFEDNASFVGTKQIFNKIRQIDNTANQHQLWGNGDLQNGNPARLLDTPTYRVTGMDSTLAINKKILLYGNVRKAFTILDRIGMSVELIPMLFTTPSLGAALPTGQRGFYAHWRNNSKVVNADAVRVLKMPAS